MRFVEIEKHFYHYLFLFCDVNENNTICFSEERIRERSEELERIKKEHAQRNGSAKKKGKKKAVKHLMSQIFHMPHHSQNSQNHLNAKDDKTKTSPTAHNPLLSNNTSPNDNQNHRRILSASAHNVRSTIANLTDSNRSRQFINNTSPPRRSIGHPSSMSEYGFPTIIGMYNFLTF